MPALWCGNEEGGAWGPRDDILPPMPALLSRRRHRRREAAETGFLELGHRASAARAAQ
jgi:hypothetical protein